MEPLQHRWTVEPILGTTHVPFQVPDVGISGGNNAFSRKATSILSQIILAGRVIEDEANHFLSSRCWERLADVPLAYTPEDFIAICYNFAIVFGHALELIDKEKPHRLELAPWTLPPRSDAEVTANTIKSLLQTAATVVEQLRKKKRDLVRALNMTSEEKQRLDDISDPTMHKVPVVSPREIRLWCVLNTVEFHNKIEEKLGQGPVEFKKFFARAPEIVDEGRKAPNTEFPQMPDFEGRSDGDKAKEVTQFNPSVFFFCSGVTEKGQRAHNSVHIGSTQEQLASWPGLWFLRRDTRRISLDASPRLWFDFYQDLSAIETRFSGKAKLFQFREEAMRWRLGLSSNLPARLTAQDDERLPVLRSCGHHIGQAFKQGDVNFFPIDCCYVCKLTIGYAEAKAIRTRTMAEDFNMEGRIKLPWSCAEVAASTWCDDPWYSNEQSTESGESA